MLNDYPLCLFKCVASYLNVMIRFRGSLLISKCFTSQETVFFFLHIFRLSLTDFLCYKLADESLTAQQKHTPVLCLNRNLHMVPDTSTIQSQQLITMANIFCCAFEMAEDTSLEDVNH